MALRWDDIDTNSTHNIYKHTHILAKIFVGIMHNFFNLFKSCFNFTKILYYIFILKFTRQEAHVVLRGFFSLFWFFLTLRYLLKTDKPKPSKEEIN